MNPFPPRFHRVVVLDKVTDFILFLGQLAITAGVGRYLCIPRLLCSKESHSETDISRFGGLL